MSNKIWNNRLLNTVVILLVSVLLSSCGILSAAQNAVKNVVVKQTATAEPTPPNEGHATAGPEAGPILEREFDEVPFSLINDRLFIRMPVGAQDVARQPGIMYAEKSNDAETRLMLEGNGQKLVVLAQDTFAYTDHVDNDLAKILKSLHGESFACTTKPLQQSGDGFKVIGIAPDTIDTSEESVLIREALIRVADGTLITIDVYVSPETAADQELCLKQADRILQSIKPGTRKWLTKAHDETIAEELNIKLEKEYVLISETGADFIVYYILKIVKVGEPAPSIGIYIGEHPTLLYPQRGVEESQLIKTKDNVLKTNVEWWASKPYPDKENYSAETVFDLPRSDMLMHIFIDAADEAEFRTVKEMVKTMRFK